MPFTAEKPSHDGQGDDDGRGDEGVVGGSARNLRYGLKPTGLSIVRPMSYETLLVERADGIVTVTMNRPERKNAANGVMWDELLAVFREVAASDRRPGPRAHRRRR